LGTPRAQPDYNFFENPIAGCVRFELQQPDGDSLPSDRDCL
jgi:hypothetical protein